MSVDILIPTFRRPAALAVTLTSLVGQTSRDFNVIISDQTPEYSSFRAPEVETAIRVLESHGHRVSTHRHVPSRGMAEHRAFLLSCASAPYVLYLDDDLVLEPFVVEQLTTTIRRYRCGFVGSAVIGLTHRDDVRPHEQQIEFWDEAPQPERLRPNGPEWQRHKLHNAANVLHLQQRTLCNWRYPRIYKVAWVGACVLYDRLKLEFVGGFDFWDALPPEHAGEDVLAQLRVMERFGGCAVLPSGVYHQELPTTIEDRRFNASELFASRETAERHRASTPEARAHAKPIVAELSPADLLARIVQLELVLERMGGALSEPTDGAQSQGAAERQAVMIRLDELRRIKEKALPESEHLRSLYDKLKEGERRVYDVEQRIRMLQAKTPVPDVFAPLATAHYASLDRLKRIKREINDYLHCELTEDRAFILDARKHPSNPAERLQVRITN